MTGNTNLNKASIVKNDEFYTKLVDIEKELKHYKHHFKNKIVLCNCDDPKHSNFWKYFKLNFKELKLKKLIATHYNKEKQSYKFELYKNEKEELYIEKKYLSQNGDFRSQECIEILKEADIVVTNPPFSLFREYVAQLIKYEKKFLIIGNKNAITYKEIFPLLKDNKIWIGYNLVKEFMQPDGSMKKFGNIGWYTNLDIDKRHDDLIIYKKYSPEEYPKYDDYNAINVNKISDIPCDYFEAIGVPITYLDKHNPKQFEIIGNLGSYGVDGYSLAASIHINGKKIFKRILIKRKVTSDVEEI